MHIKYKQYYKQLFFFIKLYTFVIIYFLSICKLKYNKVIQIETMNALTFLVLKKKNFFIVIRSLIIKQ